MYNALFYLSFCLLFFSVSFPSPCISFPFRNTNDLLIELSAFILLICIVQSGKCKHFYFWDVFMMSWKKFLILASSFFSFLIFSGVCATLTVLKPTSILFVLPMGNLMIMHVKSKRHHARNRRKLKSCLWVDVKVTLITKLISKNVFNFCSGKKRTRAGFLFGTSYISIRLLQFILWSTGCGRGQSPPRYRCQARHEEWCA